MDTAVFVPPPTRLFNPVAPMFAAIVLAAVALVVWLSLAPPRIPAPGMEAASDAWRIRTAQHLRALATPRPIATVTNAQARDYLVVQLRAMGLTPQVQTATVRRSVVYFFGGRHTTIGVVRNIVARIPGHSADAATRPALLLTTHYDSGAADLDALRDAAPVAALLETARALRAAPPANDVVLLLADGEAVGMLGAKGFAEQHPLARRIGLALKFVGDSSSALRLFGASGAGADALAGWQRAAPEVRGSSLSMEMARMLPDAARVGPLAQLDAQVLLFTGGSADLTHLGDATLRLARAFGDAPLAHGVHAARAVFALPLVGPVQHTHAVNWALALLSAIILAGAWRRFHGVDGAPDALQGLFAVAFLLVIARIGTWTWRQAIEAAGIDGDARAPLILLAVTLCAFTAGLALLRRSVGAASTVLGALAWAASALIPVMIVLPGAAYLLAWPLALALCAVVALLSPWGRRQGGALRMALLLAGLMPAPVLFAPALRDAWQLLAPQRMYMVPMLMALPMLCFASLSLMLRAGPAVACAAMLAAAGLIALGPGPAAPGLPKPPGIERLVYFKDMNSWRAYWLLPPQPFDAISARLFAGSVQPAIHVDLFGWHSPRQWLAVAPRDDAIAFPSCFILLNQVGKVRLARFTVRSLNRAPHIELWMAGAKALRSRLDGRVLTNSEGSWRLSLYGMGDRLLRFEIESAPDDIFAVTVEERMQGLPRHLLPEAPDGEAPLPAHLGSTISTDILRFY